MIRATNMAAAFANAVVKQDPKGKKHWVARTVIERATHTNIGNVKERDIVLHVSHKTRD